MWKGYFKFQDGSKIPTSQIDVSGGVDPWSPRGIFIQKWLEDHNLAYPYFFGKTNIALSQQLSDPNLNADQITKMLSDWYNTGDATKPVATATDTPATDTPATDTPATEDTKPVLPGNVDITNPSYIPSILQKVIPLSKQQQAPPSTNNYDYNINRPIGGKYEPEINKGGDSGNASATAKPVPKWQGGVDNGQSGFMPYLSNVVNPFIHAAQPAAPILTAGPNYMPVSLNAQRNEVQMQENAANRYAQQNFSPQQAAIMMAQNRAQSIGQYNKINEDEQNANAQLFNTNQQDRYKANYDNNQSLFNFKKAIQDRQTGINNDWRNNLSNLSEKAIGQQNQNNLQNLANKQIAVSAMSDPTGAQQKFLYYNPQFAASIGITKPQWDSFKDVELMPGANLQGTNAKQDLYSKALFSKINLDQSKARYYDSKTDGGLGYTNLYGYAFKPAQQGDPYAFKLGDSNDYLAPVTNDDTTTSDDTTTTGGKKFGGKIKVRSMGLGGTINSRTFMQKVFKYA